MNEAAEPAGADSIAAELRWINWLLLVLYGVAALFVVLSELRFESAFYPEPFRFYFGTMIVPALVPAWFGFLIADLIHRYRWQRLAGSIAAGVLMMVGYFLIGAMTPVRG